MVLHMAKKIKSNTDGPFFANKDNKWYLFTTPVLVMVALLLPDVGAAMGFAPNAWSAISGWMGGSLIGGFFDMKAGTQARAAK